MMTAFKKSFSRSVVLAAGTALAYWIWRRSRQTAFQPSPGPDVRADELLARAAPLLRLPTSPDLPPEIVPEGAGLRCPATGRVYPYRDGVLWLLDENQVKTLTQQTLDTTFTAWAYDRFRESITRALGSPDFAVEVAMAQRVLQVESGDVLLDLACGHGNFTVEWAKRAGAAGLVIGLDYSPAMLARAVSYVRRWGLDNVLLVHGDAHALPFASGVLRKINCSGGFHQFPDLPQALREIARVSAPGARLAASTFAAGVDDPRAGLKQWFRRAFELHFVSLVEMGEQLAALGYTKYAWSLPGSGWFGYASALKRNSVELA